MRRFIVLVLLAWSMLLSTCVAPEREMAIAPTIAPTEQATAIAVEATETSVPTVAPTVAPTESESETDPIEVLFRVYMFHAILEESILETAQDIQSKKIDGLEGMGQVVALSLVLTGLDEAFKINYPTNLTPHVETAQRQQSAFKDILSRWLEKEITSTDVPGLLSTINIEGNTTAFVEELRSQGLTSEDFKQMVERMQEDAKEAFPEEE